MKKSRGSLGPKSVRHQLGVLASKSAGSLNEKTNFGKIWHLPGAGRRLPTDRPGRDRRLSSRKDVRMTPMCPKKLCVRTSRSLARDYRFWRRSGADRGAAANPSEQSEVRGAPRGTLGVCGARGGTLRAVRPWDIAHRAMPSRVVTSKVRLPWGSPGERIGGCAACAGRAVSPRDSPGLFPGTLRGPSEGKSKPKTKISSETSVDVRLKRFQLQSVLFS